MPNELRFALPAWSWFVFAAWVMWPNLLTTLATIFAFIYAVSVTALCWIIPAIPSRSEDPKDGVPHKLQLNWKEIDPR